MFSQPERTEDGVGAAGGAAEEGFAEGGAGYVVGGEEGEPVSGHAGEGEVVLAGEVHSGGWLDDADAAGVAG